MSWRPDRHMKKASEEVAINPLFARRGEESVPRYRLSEEGLLPETAYQIVHDELTLDGSARLNLATFVGTWMEPEAQKLYVEAANKNIIDKDEYPETAAIEERCLKILANLWNAPDPANSIGVSTTGSSEACMLGGLALKRRWQLSRRQQGKSTDHPNIVFSSAVQVVWEKFANYFEVEPRYVNITPEHPYLTPEGVIKAVDENTIGVVPILGVTYTGSYEPVEAIAQALDDLEKRTGLSIPIHVDAASGGFVAPFLQPDLVWDFRLPRVHSINTSGHKYGLVYPGLGWVLWRDKTLLPEELIFNVSYLGGSMPTFGLNFSRPGAQVLLQYYNFLRLGRQGYYTVQKTCQNVAHFLAQEIGAMEPFELVTDGSDLPVFAWRKRPEENPLWSLEDLSFVLRERGWQVPAYPLPPTMQDVTIMRIVVRNSFSMDMAQLFLDDLNRAVAYLQGLDHPFPQALRQHKPFHH
ncbi:glutamate decarboxylase [Sulfobacillus thermosulfidooxidans DSM 9293]|uniref:Glutamate decarboxylase n=1 Tax=Sulfobacillus thermosulfidooxidans (strain DSM 9293 / VKM B-1269 / AT-1) TaxID=929705 RepID=A0A1W1WF42_SULTA|nr:glutamate decarboxylase [Sulfobacillus thermosulfidooxidans]SMC04789.1 glutamate decarboxylase [Sulfobacillus thermosulfidooxidans DSM 9293]